MGRRMNVWAAGAVWVLAGCPDPEPAKTAEPPAPAPDVAPAPQRPVVPPAPSGPERTPEERAWTQQASAGGTWLTNTVVRLKDPVQRASVLVPMERVQGDLERALRLYRALPMGASEGGSIPFEKAISEAVRSNQALRAQSLDGPFAAGLVVFSDARLLYSAPILSTPAGWRSVQSGLKGGESEPEVRRISVLLLDGVLKAQQGQWAQALEVYEQAWLLLARRATPGAEFELEEVERALTSGDDLALDLALETWTLQLH